MATGDIIRLGGGTNFSEKSALIAGLKKGLHAENLVLDITGKGLIHSIKGYGNYNVSVQIDGGEVYNTTAGLIQLLLVPFETSLKVYQQVNDNVTVIYSLEE